MGAGGLELGGPLQGDEPSIPRSDDILDSAKLWEIGTGLQPLHAGIFVALGALVAYHLLLNRTTLGYEVRAVGFNPEAARSSGISVGRNYVLVMAVCGLFAGFAFVELVAKGGNFPAVARWRLRGFGFTLLYFALATYALARDDPATAERWSTWGVPLHEAYTLVEGGGFVAVQERPGARLVEFAKLGQRLIGCERPGHRRRDLCRPPQVDRQVTDQQCPHREGQPFHTAVRPDERGCRIVDTDVG